MTPFLYERAPNAEAALALGSNSGSKYLGGGTNLVDLMRETIEHPSLLVDVSGLSQKIWDTNEGGLKIEAAARNSAVAADRRVRELYPMLSQAILAGASPQIRNMATVGGNMMQRTRCMYFYDDAARCNKRNPGQGCDAIVGFNRAHAVLGASTACIATHPSDMCVALSALDALVSVANTHGTREIPIVDFHRLPDDSPNVETALTAGEMIAAVTLPKVSASMRSMYRKVRDRASYAFALVSLAAALKVEDGLIIDVRLALGGVAHKPWRATIAEAMLIGKPASEADFHAAAHEELKAARALKDNGFKIELARRLIVDTLAKLLNAHGARQ